MAREIGRRAFLGTVATASTVLIEAVHRGTVSASGGGQATSVSAIDQEEESSVTPTTSKDLWPSWLALWNGDLQIADAIVAPNFVAHFAPVGTSPAEVRGPEGLKAWIAGTTAAFDDYRFRTAVGPLAEGDLVAGRWVFQGRYQGGFPGAAPDAVGREVEYAGMDLLRVDQGQIVEYWLSADILQLLQQVGAIPS